MEREKIGIKSGVNLIVVMMIPTLKQVRLKEFGYLPVGLTAVSGTVSYVAGRFYASVVVDIDEKSANSIPCTEPILNSDNNSFSILFE